MDPLDFKTNDELTQFFRCNKTVISGIEHPDTLFRQLRDHNLIPEDKYKKLMKMRCMQRKVKGVYEVLEWLETTCPENISHFWKCVFKDHILQQYPILRLLRDKLLSDLSRNETLMTKVGDTDVLLQSESSTSSGKLPEKKGTMEAEGGKGVKRKITGDGNKAGNLEDAESSEEEQTGLLSKAAPMRKEKLGTSRCSSPFKKSKTEEIRIQQNILPVVCGDKKGSLYREKLAKGEKCIKADERWFYPFEFEEYAGKKSSRNWKTSIRYQDTTLLKLIKKGDLTCGKFKQRCSPSIARPELKNQAEVSTSGSKSKRQRKEAGESPAGGAEAHDRGDGEEYVSHFAGNRLPVTCGSARGILHKDRFVSGLQGKCIRMEDKWVTPVDFLKENPTSRNSKWMSRILCSGKPLSDLLEKRVLNFHPLQCQCSLCTNQDQALREQDNDDDCFVCDVPGRLLCCDQCPRAFHFECHLPAVTGEAADYSNKWICTYCVLKNTQGWRHPCEMTLQVALESPISARLLDCQYLLLCLYKEDKEKVLKGDPQHLASNYTKVIKEPMWLDKIAEKLQNKSYSTVGQFFSDVQLMFRNCASLSQGNYYVELATKLTSLFDEEFRKVFFIHR